MIGDGEPMRSELDLLVAAVKEMTRIRKEIGYIPAQQFRDTMVNYFGLNFDTANTFVFDDLVRLAGIPAGTLKGRKQADLTRLCELTNGDRFVYNGNRCRFNGHALGGEYGDVVIPNVGYTNIRYELIDHGLAEATISLDDAWTAMAEGRLTIG